MVNHKLSNCSLFKILANGIAIMFLTSCGGDDDNRPEVISKLRSLGVEQSPINAKPGDVVNLTYYLAIPSDQVSNQSVTANVLIDQAARYGTPITVVPVDPTPVETKVGPLSLYSYRATMTVPNSPEILAAIAKQGFARVRYNVKFANNSNDEENVVGDTIVYAEGAPQLTWTAPDLAINKPSTSAGTGSIDLEGTVNSSGNETNRIAWFTSSGKVKNRRAKTTTWTDQTSGSQAVIMTARGVKSGAFAIKSQPITIN